MQVSPVGSFVSPPDSDESSIVGPGVSVLVGWASSGTVGYLTGRGPRAVVVNYAVTDDQVVFRLPEYNEICQYAPGREITLNVSCVCASTRTEVVVTGVGFVPDHQAGSVEVRRPGRGVAGRHLHASDLSRPRRRRRH